MKIENIWFLGWECPIGQGRCVADKHTILRVFNQNKGPLDLEVDKVDIIVSLQERPLSLNEKHNKFLKKLKKLQAP